MGNTECKGCSTADPTTDTVKVNAEGTLLTTAEVGDKLKEQLQQLQKEQQEQEQQQQPEKEEDHEQELREAEAQRVEQERQRMEAEAQQSLELERAEAQAKEEQRVREEIERAEKEATERLATEEAARKTEEEKQRAAEERAHKEAQQKSGAFLRSHGFTSAMRPKTSCMKVNYPLQVAVQENKADVVAALLHCGADKQVKNKAGQTPLQIAQKMNKNGSHQAVITALS